MVDLRSTRMRNSEVEGVGWEAWGARLEIGEEALEGNAFISRFLVVGGNFL